MIVVLVHILIFGYTKFHQHDVYCTPSTKKLSTALNQMLLETSECAVDSETKFTSLVRARN